MSPGRPRFLRVRVRRVNLQRVPDPDRPKVPALVVSGFLGSGKTTLVRHLLESAQRQKIRVAVISNELGELGIDKALLGRGGEAFVELEGGCVCCRVSRRSSESSQQTQPPSSST